MVHLRFAHLGSAEEGAALLAPMRAAAEPIADMVDEMPFAAIDAIHADPTDPMPIWDESATLSALPAEAVDAYLPYVQARLDEGVPLSAMTRHMLGLFHGRPGARTWRRILTVEAIRPGAGVEVIERALSAVTQTPRAAAA